MLKSGVVVMAKNSKMNSLFGTELNGFKKRQVNEYILDLEDAHRAKIEEYEKAKAEMQAELDSLNSQYTELLEKYNLVQLKCEGNGKIYKDILVYRNGYKLTELDKMFIEEVVKARKNLLDI